MRQAGPSGSRRKLPARPQIMDARCYRRGVRFSE